MIIEILPKDNSKQVIKELLSVMNMQEKRETEEFHIPQPTAWSIWNGAKQDAMVFLGNNN